MSTPKKNPTPAPLTTVYSVGPASGYGEFTGFTSLPRLFKEIRRMLKTCDIGELTVRKSLMVMEIDET